MGIAGQVCFLEWVLNLKACLRAYLLSIFVVPKIKDFTAI